MEDLALTFEEKYEFSIDEDYLKIIMRDLQKIYTADTYINAYEDILNEHKRKQMLPTIFLKDMFNSFYRYRLFWGCLIQFMTVFSGIFVVIFYTVPLFNDVSDNGGIMFVFVSLGACFGPLPGYFIGKHLGRKSALLVGTLGQCIMAFLVGIMIITKWYALLGPALILFMISNAAGLGG